MGAVAHLVVWTLSAAIFTQNTVSHQRVAPIRKVDRMRVVGGPVFELDARPGIYVWVENGFFQVAAVGGARSRRTLRVKLETSAAITSSELGDFRAMSVGRQRLVLEARVEKVPARARFKTQGELVVSDARMGPRTVSIYVGPLGERAAARVRIGRY